MIKVRHVAFAPIESDNIYKEDVIEQLVEDGELSYEEAGFMEGYNDW